MNETWYKEINPSVPISQGDIFFNCPVYTPSPDFNFKNLETLSEAKFKLGYADIIILTQACDLNLNNGKVIDNVVCAKIDEVDNDDSWSFVSSVNSNRQPSYHLLNKKDSGEFDFGYQIIDFTSIYTIPYSLLNAFREYHGSRARLQSPYLENLSQRFGHFFARIGLPDETIVDSKDLKTVVQG